MDINNLQVNLSKTKYLQFYNKGGKKINLDTKYNNNTISEYKSSLFLGLTIDSHCDWYKHVDNVCAKINRFIYPLRRLRLTTTQQIAVTAYYGYVASVIRYGLLLWGNSVQINRVLLMQKKCVRAICGIAPTDSCRPFFKQLKLLTVAGMYIQEVVIFVKSHEELFVKHGDVFPKSRTPFMVVHSILPKSRVFEKNSYSMCVRIFNHLPKYLSVLPLTLLKPKLYTWLLDKCFYSLKEYFDNKNK